MYWFICRGFKLKCYHIESTCFEQILEHPNSTHNIVNSIIFLKKYISNGYNYYPRFHTEVFFPLKQITKPSPSKSNFISLETKQKKNH